MITPDYNEITLTHHLKSASEAFESSQKHRYNKTDIQLKSIMDQINLVCEAGYFETDIIAFKIYEENIIWLKKQGYAVNGITINWKKG